MDMKHTNNTSLQLPLTNREQEILRWIGNGKSNPDIATILNISPFTVKAHAKNVIIKLDATNRVHAVAKALCLGLIDPE